MCQEVRDAYILSASRTPTAKVCPPATFDLDPTNTIQTANRPPR